MKGIKRLYLLAIIFAGFVGILLVQLLLPDIYFWTALGILMIPLFIVGISFRLITNSRIRQIRKQLYQIIQTLEDFDIDAPTAVQFKSSPFVIFNELNEYLLELIDRIRADFQANKQFNQNASHELQTPLAIIKGNAEILLQSPNMREKEMGAIGTILQNVNRLSKLNSALILLSKIEHGRFADISTVDFTAVTEDALKNYQDIIRLQDIKITKLFGTPFQVEMSQVLAETLVNNLLQNAIRYNLPDTGRIQITMDQQQYIISNPGKPPLQAPENMFRRFSRESKIEESLGLGLSIIKRICEQSGLNVSYNYAEDLHTLSITKV